MSAFAAAIRGKAGHAVVQRICLLLTQSGHRPEVRGTNAAQMLTQTSFAIRQAYCSDNIRIGLPRIGSTTVFFFSQ
jgi:hypothetical protein